jgi:hypothetical protein
MQVPGKYRLLSLIPSIFLCSFNSILLTALGIQHEMESNRIAAEKKYCGKAKE